MKKTLLLFLILLVSGCSGLKKTTKSDIRADVISQTEVKKTADENQILTTSVNAEKKTEATIKKNTSAEENETEETTIHTINYDSKTPVDSVTRKPAISQEIIQKTVKGKNVKAVESTEMLYSQAEVQSLFQVYFKISKSESDSVNKVISMLRTEVREQTKKANYWWVWLLAGMCVPVVGWIALKSGWPAKVFVWVVKILKNIKKIRLFSNTV